MSRSESMLSQHLGWWAREFGLGVTATEAEVLAADLKRQAGVRGLPPDTASWRQIFQHDLEAGVRPESPPYSWGLASDLDDMLAEFASGKTWATTNSALPCCAQRAGRGEQAE